MNMSRSVAGSTFSNATLNLSHASSSRHTHARHAVGVRPNDILDKLDPLLLQVLQLITEHPPFCLPLLGRLREGLDEVRKVAFVGADGALSFLELRSDAVELSALREGRLRSVRVDT
jgi:hypothetical protein